MKKLMVAAAAAAMATGAFATTQVYQMSMNMMTTACQSGQINANAHPFVADIPAPGNPIVNLNWRTPISAQILGLIWMCDCDYLVDLGVWANDVDGYADNAFGRAANAAGHVGVPARRVVGRYEYIDAGNVQYPDNRWQYYVSAIEAGAVNPVIPPLNTIYNPAYNSATDVYTWANRQNSAEGYIFWEATSGTPVFYGEIEKTADYDGNGTVDIWDWRPRGTVANQAAPTPANYATQAMMPTFQWNFLQRIGQYAEQVEGCWMIDDLQSGHEKFFLMGSGFGTMAAIGTDDNDCTEVIASMYGYFGGWMPGPSTGATPNSCIFCGNNGIGALPCNPWLFCRCASAFGLDTSKTAAYGVWQLQYNPTLSARLNTAGAALTPAENTEIGNPATATTGSIRKIFTFSAATEEYIKWLEACRL